MLQKVLLDTNVLLRLILKDNNQQLKEIIKILEQAESGKINLYCKSISIFEIVFVLSGKMYQTAKSEIVEILKTMLNISVINFEESKELSLALDIFLDYSISAVDSFLIANCILNKQDFFSFDTKANKIYKQVTKK